MTTQQEDAPPREHRLLEGKLEWDDTDWVLRVHCARCQRVIFEAYLGGGRFPRGKAPTLAKLRAALRDHLYPYPAPQSPGETCGFLLTI